MSDKNPAEPAKGTENAAESVAENVIAAVAGFAGWASRTSAQFARKLPGAALVETELQQLERTVLVELRRRLDNADPLHDGRSAEEERAARVRAVPPPKQTEPLRVAMAELLMRSIEQTKQRAREYLYLTILRQLLPDEARILSALADGSVFPLVHVDYRTGVAGTHRVLANASTVGRASGVSGVHAVPRYLTRLLHLDLIQTGEADPTLSVQYDICMTDDNVRAAEDEARKHGRVRVVRETVAISPFGRELWDACHPREEHLDDAPTPIEDVVAAAPAFGIESLDRELAAATEHAATNGTKPAPRPQT